MIVTVVGLSHKTAPVEIREKVAFPEKIQEEALRKLLEADGMAEAMILSTCNRVEIYAVGRDADTCTAGLADFMAAWNGFPVETLAPHLYRLCGDDAIRHIMRVSASLDSMILGEPQILGQLKEAYDRALGHGCTGRILNELMKKTFSVAKAVRTDTGIARSAVSISFAAVELARKIFDDLSGKSVMVIGAGEMAELAVKHLISQGVTEVMVVNRTFDKAVELATAFNGSAIKFEDLAEHLVSSDIVIGSTGAPHYVVTPEIMRKVIHQRKNKPVFLIDISVPRNIDPKVNDLENVYLYDIDDLQSVVEANIKERRKEADKAAAMVEREREAFSGWLASLQVVPLIVALREKLDRIRAAELEKALGRLPNLGPKEQEAVKALAAGIVNKILHEPTTVLKRASRETEMVVDVETVRRLFGLDTNKAEERESNDGN
jgi:glutamyl-tRNA reductase